MKLSLNRKGVNASGIINILLILVVAGAVMTTIVSTFANSTYTGLTGAGATMAALAPLFIVLAIIMWIVRKK